MGRLDCECQISKDNIMYKTHRLGVRTLHNALPRVSAADTLEHFILRSSIERVLNRLLFKLLFQMVQHIDWSSTT